MARTFEILEWATVGVCALGLFLGAYYLFLNLGAYYLFLKWLLNK